MRLTSSALKQRESAQRFSYRRQGAEMVRRRWEANGRRCEGCGEVVDIVEVAHLFSRAGHIISDEYASTGELMAALCCVRSRPDMRVGCHEQIDRGLAPDRLSQLRWQAVARFARKHGLSIPSVEEYDELGAIRALVDAVEARG